MVTKVRGKFTEFKMDESGNGSVTGGVLVSEEIKLEMEASAIKQ
ncbi:hypothetical protein CCONF_11380 [Corynebacterium confusum]|nr:hypothetical protein CCONF_11380 [Corynebacterium confusum]